MTRDSNENELFLLSENKQLRDKVSELSTKLVAYEKMHDRAVKDIQEYSKALEIWSVNACHNSDPQCKNEDCIECVIKQARSEIANGR